MPPENGKSLFLGDILKRSSMIYVSCPSVDAHDALSLTDSVKPFL
jgi:hypothetical protein